MEFTHLLLHQMLTKTAGSTPLSFMMVELTLVESTSTVFLTGKVPSVLPTVVDTLSLVVVIMEREITLVLSTRLLSGTLL